jgi:hypothetical protein
MKKYLKLLLFIPAFSMACDGGEIEIERLMEIPVVKSGDVQLIKKWGRIPASININSYKSLAIRSRSKVKDNRLEVQFYKDKELLHGLSSEAVKNSVKIQKSFYSIFKKSLDKGATKMIITAKAKGLKSCKKEVRLWQGD